MSKEFVEKHNLSCTSVKNKNLPLVLCSFVKKAQFYEAREKVRKQPQTNFASLYARQSFYKRIYYYTPSLGPYQGSALDLGDPSPKITPTRSQIPRSAPASGAIFGRVYFMRKQFTNHVPSMLHVKYRSIWNIF